MPAIALRSQILRELAARVGSSQAELEKFYGLENNPVSPQAPQAPKQIQDTAPREFPNKFNQAKPAWKGKDKVATRNAEIAKQKPIAPTDLAEQLMRIFLQFPMLAKNLTEQHKKLSQLAAKARSEKAVGVMADLIERASQQVDGTAFAAFQSVLEESSFAKAYEVLRARVMQADMTLEDAQKNLDGAFKKLEIDEIKREMSEITDKIEAGTVTTEEKARYRQLGVMLR
jgi:DNA primase